MGQVLITDAVRTRGFPTVEVLELAVKLSGRELPAAAITEVIAGPARGALSFACLLLTVRSTFGDLIYREPCA